MTERVNYLGVTMEAATAEVLAELDKECEVSNSGVWLYTLMRAVGGNLVTAYTDDVDVLIWMVLGTKSTNATMQAVVSSEIIIDLQGVLQRAKISDELKLFASHGVSVGWQELDERADILLYNQNPPKDYPWWSPSWHKGLSFCPAQAPITERPFPPESVVVGGAWRLYGGDKLAYPASEREKLVAILLAAMQPKTLALGMNVVFDGKMKPQKSKINFSGTGGQIGEGDVLICHPDDLNRYTPLPGAVALVLGDLTEPVQAFTCALPVGDEVLTIVIK